MNGTVNWPSSYEKEGNEKIFRGITGMPTNKNGDTKFKKCGTHPVTAVLLMMRGRRERSND